MNVVRLTRVVVGFAITLHLCACAMTREQQLRRKSEKVEDALLAQQGKVLDLPQGSGERSPRLDHLTNLRLTLSAANIALAAVPRVVPEEKRDIAYDVLDEAYDTIAWNIPLGPSDVKRTMPLPFAKGPVTWQELVGDGSGGTNLSPGIR